MAFHSTEGRALGLQVSLPWVEGADLRPWVPREHSLVLSSSASAAGEQRVPASLLTMQWAAEADLARQQLQVPRLYPGAPMLPLAWLEVVKTMLDALSGTQLACMEQITPVTRPAVGKAFCD